nr:MAG TPA: hypothetical protein [Caudoviricetes sp.]
MTAVARPPLLLLPAQINDLRRKTNGRAKKLHASAQKTTLPLQLQ